MNVAAPIRMVYHLTLYFFTIQQARKTGKPMPMMMLITINAIEEAGIISIMF